MKKSFLLSAFLMLFVSIAFSVQAAVVDKAVDEVQVEQVIEMQSADQITTETQFESFSPVMDVGKDANQMITSDFEDDHQVFSAEFRQYDKQIDRAETTPKTARGHRSLINSPPQIGFN